jgi:hypothetical protein
LKVKQAILPVRIATRAVSVVIGLFLLVCFALAVAGRSEPIRLLGQEFGVVVATAVFFQFAAGNSDILTAVRKLSHGVLVVVWYGSIVGMVVIVLAWTRGHLTQTDDVLTVAFLLTYAALPSTKYISLMVTSTHGNKMVQGLLGVFVLIPMLLGWVYLMALTHPGLLWGWLPNAILFSTAMAWGISYGMDTVLRGRRTLPMRGFLIAISLQAGFMLLVGVIGAYLPSSAPLIIGLLCQETLANIPGGGLDFITELFQKKPEDGTRWYRPKGFLLWSSAIFGGLLCILMVLCFFAILVKDYTILILAGGITIGVLQAVPWFRNGQRACLEWAEKPARALSILVTMLTISTVVIIGLATWIALRGGYSEANLTAIWYSIARIPTAISLSTFGLYGVLLVGLRAPQEWKVLLFASTACVFVGFLWFIPALIIGGVGAIVGPGLMMQISGGIIVSLVYQAFNSDQFREDADAALDGKPETWGSGSGD